LKIISLVGARPQFIKYAPLAKKLSSRFEECLVHSGQHYDSNLSDLFFRQFGIRKPDVHLNVGSHSQARQTALILEAFEKQLARFNPQFVLVFGDTNTTLAGALAAAKMNVKILHIEAGLRSNNRAMPEEINRIIVDRISDYLSCPIRSAVDNLHRENIKDGVFFSGDIMLDAFYLYKNMALSIDVLKPLGLEAGKYFLCTIHRAENTNNPERLKNIFKALSALAFDVVLPLHPRTRTVLQQNGIKATGNIKIIEPVGYFEMMNLLLHCHKVLTDSGGLQKEAYFARKFCKTLRAETEWADTLEDDHNVLCGSDVQKIIEEAEKKERAFADRNDIFGEGRASDKIIEIIESAG